MSFRDAICYGAMRYRAFCDAAMNEAFNCFQLHSHVSSVSVLMISRMSRPGSATISPPRYHHILSHCALSSSSHRFLASSYSLFLPFSTKHQPRPPLQSLNTLLRRPPLFLFFSIDSHHSSRDANADSKDRIKQPKMQDLALYNDTCTIFIVYAL